MTKSLLNTEFARKAALLACSALVSVAVAAPVLAQAAEEETGVADIVVTAQKREQSVQDVPVAVTAISADTLKVNRVVSLLDLSSQAPNLAVRTTAGGLSVPTYTMRGSQTYGSVTGQDKTIGVYQDGVYLGFAQGSGTDMPELQRLEVLRGPQGTLFGRNSTAGAISLVTRDPSGEFGVRQSFTYGNYNQKRSSTSIETPTWGPFSALVNYTHTEREGEVKNLGAGYQWDLSGAPATSWARTKIKGVSPKRLGDKNNESIFVAIKFEPSDSFKAVYKFDWVESRFTPEANFLGALNTAILSGGAASYQAFLDALYTGDYAVKEISDRKRPKAIHNAYATDGFASQQGHNLTATWKAADDVTVKNVLAYRKGGIVANTDIAGHTAFLNNNSAAAYAAMTFGYLTPPVGTPVPFFGVNSEAHNMQWSDELQVNYTSDAVTLTTGAIYFKIKTRDGAPDHLTSQFFTAPVYSLDGQGYHPGVVPSGAYANNRFLGKSMAAYAQAEIHVTPQLDLVGGIRVTHDKKDGTSYNIAANLPLLDENGTPVTACPEEETCTANPLYRGVAPGSQLIFNSKYRATKSTYLLGVNYKVNDDVLLFAKYSTGFVSGGATSGKAYQPETVKAWEAGIKADLLDRRLRANLALFSAKYKNLQAVGGGNTLPVKDYDLSTLILREGDLDTKGFELELTAVPIQSLTLSASAGYTDLKLKNVNPLLRINNIATVRPKWTGNFSAQYDSQPLFGDAFLSFRLDGNYRSSTLQSQYPAFYNPDPNRVQFLSSDSMLILNGRIALRDINIAGSKAELALWGRNLGNVIRPNQPIDFVGAMTTTYTSARTYGVDLSFEF